MSEFSQPLSTCSRTTDFSFAFNNDAFSDAVLVLLVLRPKGASISRRLISSVAQLWLSAAQVTANTVANTVAGAVPAGDALHTATKLLDKYGSDAVGWLAPREAQELVIANVFQVNSALLAASSPYLRHLIQTPQHLTHLVPGLAAVAARNRQRKLVAVMVQPQHLLAAEAVVRFIFTNDIALTSAQEAVHALLVAEQLQVPDCAEVCQHYLEDCAMDWGVALTLVHLQHKHQQEQHHARQQQWQRLYQPQQQQQQPPAASTKGGGAASMASTRRAPLYPRGGSTAGSLLRRGAGGSSALDAITPLLPVPSESVHLQGLLLRAQDFLLRQFEDLELVLGSAEGREQLLLLPYDALRAILQHPRLKVASENTALLAAAGWLGANAAQVNSLLLSRSSSGAGGIRPQPGGPGTAYSSALYSSNGNNSQADAAGEPTKAAADGADAAAQAQSGGAAAEGVQQQQPLPPTASGVASLLLDLCQVLRLCQLSYTYVMHVLPHLPLFRDQPQLVAALQFEVLRFKAAGDLRQRCLAAEAAAAAASAASAAAVGLTGSALAGFEQQQQQAAAGGPSGEASNGAAAADASNGNDSALGWPAKSPKPTAPPQAAAPADDAWGSAITGVAPSQGWRGDGSCDAALLQCRRRPESALSVLDFTFAFEPQSLAAKPSAAAAAQAAAGGGKGSSSGDLMQRLLGLAPPQQQQPDTLLSQDHNFGGYCWNMVVGSDGFVGVSWRVVLPGGKDVQLAPAEASAAADAAAPSGSAPGGSVPGGSSGGRGFGDVRLFGPDVAGFRAPEVAVTFSITSSSGLSRGQRSSSGGSFATGSVFPGGAAANGGAAAGAGDAALKAGGATSKGGDAAAGKGGGAPLPASGAAGGAAKPAASNGPAASPIKGGGAAAAAAAAAKAAAAANKVGRAYTEPQLVPAHCAWGFPEFAAGSGWEGLKGADGKVVLRCRLQHQE